MPARLRIGNDLYLKVLQKEPRGSIRGLWYHGDIGKRTSFDSQHMDRDGAQDPNAVGPGIYLTRDRRQAHGYAAPNGYLYTIRIQTTPSRVMKDSTKPTADLIDRIIKLAPEEDRETGYSNWAQDPNEAHRQALKAYGPDSGMTLHESLMCMYREFYGRQPNIWAKAVARLGFDALLHKLPLVDHLIVYNPAIIKIVKEQKYSSSE